MSATVEHTRNSAALGLAPPANQIAARVVRRIIDEVMRSGAVALNTTNAAGALWRAAAPFVRAAYQQDEEDTEDTLVCSCFFPQMSLENVSTSSRLKLSSE